MQISWPKSSLQPGNKPESSRSCRASFKNLGQQFGTDKRTDGQTDRLHSSCVMCWIKLILPHVWDIIGLVFLLGKIYRMS